MLPELTHEETAVALDEVAAELLHEAGVTQPPVDAFAVAGALGITVARDDCQSGRARYVRLRSYAGDPRATILLQSDPRRERQHWAIAHEIGEHAAWRVFGRLDVDPREASPGCRESVANHLAGRLLLPSEWFVSHAAVCDWDLLELKAGFRTASHELIARRMLECPPAVIISICDQGRLSFRRSNVPGRAPPLSDAERACWQAVHREARPDEREADGHRVRSWPVHEPQWKREILRTEVPDW